MTKVYNALRLQITSIHLAGFSTVISVIFVQFHHLVDDILQFVTLWGKKGLAAQDFHPKKPFWHSTKRLWYICPYCFDARNFANTLQTPSEVWSTPRCCSGHLLQTLSNVAEWANAARTPVWFWLLTRGCPGKKCRWADHEIGKKHRKAVHRAQALQGGRVLRCFGCREPFDGPQPGGQAREARVHRITGAAWCIEPVELWTYSKPTSSISSWVNVSYKCGVFMVKISSLSMPT